MQTIKVKHVQAVNHAKAAFVKQDVCQDRYCVMDNALFQALTPISAVQKANAITLLSQTQTIKVKHVPVVHHAKGESAKLVVFRDRCFAMVNA